MSIDKSIKSIPNYLNNGLGLIIRTMQPVNMTRTPLFKERGFIPIEIVDLRIDFRIIVDYEIWVID